MTLSSYWLWTVLNIIITYLSMSSDIHTNCPPHFDQKCVPSVPYLLSFLPSRYSILQKCLDFHSIDCLLEQSFVTPGGARDPHQHELVGFFLPPTGLRHPHRVHFLDCLWRVAPPPVLDLTAPRHGPSKFIFYTEKRLYSITLWRRPSSSAGDPVVRRESNSSISHHSR